MTIKDDSLKILVILYNNKIKGNNEVRSDDLEIKQLKLSKIEFNNALEFLKGKKLATHHKKAITRMSQAKDIFNDSDEKSPEEIEEDKKLEYENNIIHIKIQVKGIELIEDEKKIKSNFGSNYIKKKESGKVIIIDKSISISNPSLNNVHHENTGDINYGNITKNNIRQDNSKNYSIDKIDMSTHESRSISLINKYGEKKPLIVGIVTFLAGIMTIITGFNSLFPDVNVFSWIPTWLTISEKISPYLIAVGILIASGGGYIISLIQYKYDSQCPECKKHYALNEYGEPSVKDVETKEGIRRTTTRNYQCRYCNYKESKKTNKFIPNSEIER